jgi:ribosomal protein S9
MSIVQNRKKKNFLQEFMKPGTGNITVNGKDAKNISLQMFWFTKLINHFYF